MNDADNNSGDNAQSKRSANYSGKSLDNDAASQPQEISSDYLKPAKTLWNRLIDHRIGTAIAWLNGHHDLLTALATVAIAALVCVLAWNANNQSKILQRQIADSEATQRAFLVFDPLTVVKDDNGVRIGSIITNKGITEAAQPVERTICSQDGKKFVESSPTHIVIGPQQSRSGEYCTIFPTDPSKSMPSRINVFVVERVEYSDVFNGKHVIGQCTLLHIFSPIETARPLDEGCTGELQRYTCADKDCPKDWP